MKRATGRRHVPLDSKNAEKVRMLNGAETFLPVKRKEDLLSRSPATLRGSRVVRVERGDKQLELASVQVLPYWLGKVYGS